MSEGPTDPLGVFAPNLLSGTTALVTGGGQGIGKATALAFVRYGANVIIASRDPGKLRAAAQEIEATGGRCFATEVDIRDVTSVDRLHDQSLEQFGAVGFVINNAGGQYKTNPFDISDNGWRSVVDLNLNGTWNRGAPAAGPRCRPLPRPRHRPGVASAYDDHYAKLTT